MFVWWCSLKLYDSIQVNIDGHCLPIIGGYDKEEIAARAYDLAALKYWGAGTVINFPVKWRLKVFVKCLYFCKDRNLHTLISSPLINHVSYLTLICVFEFCTWRWLTTRRNWRRCDTCLGRSTLLPWEGSGRVFLLKFITTFIFEGNFHWQLCGLKLNLATFLVRGI